MESRACGECRACCYVLGIKELVPEKPAYQHCTHECDKGCAIYEKRPEPCAGYYCLWLMEGKEDLVAEVTGHLKLPAKGVPQLLREEERPDKIGIIFEASAINSDESAFEKESGIPFLTAREGTPGAFEGYWGQKVLKRLTKKILVILLFGDGRRRAIGPPEKVRLVGQFLNKVRVTEKR